MPNWRRLPRRVIVPAPDPPHLPPIVPAARPTPSSPRAFTLVEVLVVLLLLAIAAAVVAPLLAPRVARATSAGEALLRVRARAVREGVTIDTLLDGRRLRITPLGACLLLHERADTPPWDPARCAPAVPAA